MTCTERQRLQELTASLQNELAIWQPSDTAKDLIPHPEERTMRTALFSSQIDLAFHRARCLACRTIDAHSVAPEDAIPLPNAA